MRPAARNQHLSNGRCKDFGLHSPDTEPQLLSNPNGLLDSTKNRLRRRESHRLSRSNAPTLPPTPQEQGFRPFPAQHPPLAPTQNHQFFVGHKCKPSGSNGGGTPKCWMRSRMRFSGTTPIFARCCADRGDGDRPYYSTTSFGASGKILLYRRAVRPRLEPVAIRVCLTRQRLRYAAGARYCRLDRQLSGLAA